MNKRNLLPRLIVSPAILLLLILAYSFSLLKHFIGYIRWGGELITLQKNDHKNVNDIFKLLKEELLKKPVN
jgi:hypothetical protein